MPYVPLNRAAGTLFQDNLNRMLEELYANMDFVHAENVIKEQYGDTVSVNAASENLNKFGRTSTNVGTTFATISEFQDAVTDETFATDNVVDSIVSTNAGDTQDIVVQGFTLDNTTGQLTKVTQTATLTGTTEVTLSTPLARVVRAYVGTTGTVLAEPAALAGDVTIYDNAGGITGGKPNVDAAVKLILFSGQTQSEKCATCTANNEYWIISALRAQVFAAANQTDFVTVRIETRDLVNGGAWRPLGGDVVAVPGAFPPPQTPFNPLRIVPKNHDVRAVAKTDAATAPVFAEIEGVIAEVQ